MVFNGDYLSFRFLRHRFAINPFDGMRKGYELLGGGGIIEHHHLLISDNN